MFSTEIPREKGTHGLSFEICYGGEGGGGEGINTENDYVVSHSLPPLTNKQKKNTKYERKEKIICVGYVGF